MRSHGWHDAPETVRTAIDDLLHDLRATVGPNLLGLYLHGSLAIGCFNPARSDLDLLVLTGDTMLAGAKRAVVALLLERSGDPYPIEISFLRRSDLRPWQFPTPFDLHYSEAWRARYEAGLASGAGRHWNGREREQEQVDPDLAAHITITQHRGVRLCGPPIEDAFPPVPRADYLASILGDYASARDGIARRPVYGVLNLCRAYLYLLDGRIGSKEEAGDWAAHTLPADLRPMVERALTLYRGTDADGGFAPDDLEAFARHVDGRVRALIAG